MEDKIVFEVDDVETFQRLRTGEEKLLWAKLRRMVLDYWGMNVGSESASWGVSKNIQAEARDWLYLGYKQELSDYAINRCKPFSFPWICQMLDLDPHRIQEAILNTKHVPRSKSRCYLKQLLESMPI